ncbi:MAG: hypothetical protein LBC09_03010 [Helicobacteraceae bacterium]|jgi:hypothetical protein|nr:hypothetical protein [Helicobacteraceae bacterium]
MKLLELWRIFYNSTAALKRTADFLEKMAVASFAVGIFQSDAIGVLGVAVGIIAAGWSLWITFEIEKRKE